MNIIFEGREYFVNPAGLGGDEQRLVAEVSLKVLEGAKRRRKYALSRCTFFADPGYEALLEATGPHRSPHIEGDDANCFDQHYWVAFDLAGRNLIIDPIFNYIGLEEHAQADNKSYYARKRTVKPNTAVWEGGVRINTMGI
jgi:hypothetical protein